MNSIVVCSLMMTSDSRRRKLECIQKNLNEFSSRSLRSKIYPYPSVSICVRLLTSSDMGLSCSFLCAHAFFPLYLRSKKNIQIQTLFIVLLHHLSKLFFIVGKVLLQRIYKTTSTVYWWRCDYSFLWKVWFLNDLFSL